MSGDQELVEDAQDFAVGQRAVFAFQRAVGQDADHVVGGCPASRVEEGDEEVLQVHGELRPVDHLFVGQGGQSQGVGGRGGRLVEELPALLRYPQSVGDDPQRHRQGELGHEVGPCLSVGIRRRGETLDSGVDDPPHRGRALVHPRGGEEPGNQGSVLRVAWLVQREHGGRQRDQPSIQRDQPALDFGRRALERDLLGAAQEIAELARVGRGVPQRLADQVVAGDDPGADMRFEVHGCGIAQLPVRGVWIRQRCGIEQRHAHRVGPAPVVRHDATPARRRAGYGSAGSWSPGSSRARLRRTGRPPGPSAPRGG